MSNYENKMPVKSLSASFLSLFMSKQLEDSKNHFID